MTDSGYAPGTPPSVGAGASSGADAADLGHLKKGYLSYLGLKAAEIKEQKDARRYYHASQLTSAQLRTLKKRGQPPVAYNHEAKKINSVVGLLARQRGDPKAFPRTEQQADGAEVATACLRYTVDQQQWESKDALCTLDAAVDGISGVEMELLPGDSGQEGDFDVGFNRVNPSSFFYDPRSIEADFSDARFMGMAKWADPDSIIEMFPDKADEINSSLDSGADLTSDPDSDAKWTTNEGGQRRVRLVDHWYLKGRQWHYCVYTGAVKLDEGVSPFVDEKEVTICKFIMFSANVDQDGDRYGFHRNMKASQDEINQRRSKALHVSNSRRIIVRDGEGLDVEKIRAEIVKPDGVIVIPPGAEIPQFDDVARANELQAQLGFFAEAKSELESGQFNPEAVGNSQSAISGRAIQLRQQAGIAELGPFRIGYRGWKLRLYRAIWNAIRRYWKAERAVRVTDNPQAPALIPINHLGLHPQTGQPTIINAVNALDVDIVIDEGPDTITMQQSNADALAALGKSGVPVPPRLAILLSDLDPSVKKQANDLLDKAEQAQQPGPLQQKGVMLELQGKDLANQKVASEIRVNRAKAATAAPADPNAGADLEWKKALLSSLTSIIVAKIGAKTDQESAAFEAQIEGLMHISGLQADAAAQLREHAHQAALLALQPPPQAAQTQAAA